MSLEKIQQLVSGLATSLDDNEKLATPILSAKLNKYASAYPYDQTIGSVSRVIEKMADNNKMFIRKADFKSLYNKLYTRNTKFAELFENELGAVNNEPSIKTYERDDSKSQLDPYQIADPILSNALNSIFDGTSVKMYSKSLASSAIKNVESTLNTWGLKPMSLTVEDGSDKFLVIKANYETPKGITSFYVPIEINDKKITEASVFMGNLGPEDLNHTNIKKYVTHNAGNKLQVTASVILNILTQASSEGREISDAEMALTKFNANKQGKSEFFQNQIVGQKMAEASAQNVKLPKYNQFESIEKTFSSPHGMASFKFSNENVKIGRDSIVRELSSYGHKNVQVTVLGNDENTIFYGIALDAGRIGFTVPVKLSNNKLLKPSIILCNGSISPFNEKSINQLYINNQSDFKVAASASPLYGLKSSELINNIKQALGDNNHDKAEDALNVLANSGDQKAYAVGFQVFLKGLGGGIIEAAPTCTRIVKNSTSEHHICGHTGLPMHKIYQDKEGNCRPLYRKGMEEGYEAVSFINHKIFG